MVGTSCNVAKVEVTETALDALVERVRILHQYYLSAPEREKPKRDAPWNEQEGEDAEPLRCPPTTGKIFWAPSREQWGMSCGDKTRYLPRHPVVDEHRKPLSEELQEANYERQPFDKSRRY